MKYYEEVIKTVAKCVCKKIADRQIGITKTHHDN